MHKKKYRKVEEKMSLKDRVKVGDIIELIYTTDTITNLTSGSRGVVTSVDEEQDLIWVDWENGEYLALIDGIDTYKIIKK